MRRIGFSRDCSSMTCATRPGVRAIMKMPLNAAGSIPRSARMAPIAPSTLMGSAFFPSAKDFSTARAAFMCGPSTPASREAGVDGPHMKAARAVEKSFADGKKALPINVDGAIGAILADLGMDPAAFNGIFMIARTPGLVAHVIEEQSREKPMRRIDPVNHGYDGPPSRNISE